jgi:arylsulfatase A-like enzyme
MSILAALVCACCVNLVRAQEAAPGSRHVVLVVWDGMRPDMVTKKNCPVLWRFAQEGVNFRDHHSVYLTATDVNGTALATGVYPNRSGIIANHDYYPGIDVARAVDVETLDAVRRGDKVSDGKYVGAPTIAEMVQAAGRQTVIASAKGVGLLFDRKEAGREPDSVNLFEGHTLPPSAAAAFTKALGVFPELKKRSFAQTDQWTCQALTEILWKDALPSFSLLWLSEPDATQHLTAPGSEAAVRAIKSSDDNLGRVLAALDRHHARDNTDVLVVSDHGFSTIGRSIDLRKILKDAGFDVVTEFSSDPRPGQIMLAGNGGSVLFYVVNREPAVTRKLVEFLQQSDFAGVLFTRDKFDGTFPLETAKIDSKGMPDVVLAFRWTDNANAYGVPGTIDADWQRKAGEGTHATLSKFDVHNLLVGAGPDFPRGQSDDLPSGNVDLAPTILRIIGLTPPQPMDGRILTEAMVNGGKARPDSKTTMLEATKNFSRGTWQQFLQISRVGSTVYVDEGNGEFAGATVSPSSTATPAPGAHDDLY